MTQVRLSKASAIVLNGEAHERGEVIMWTIYERPADFPEFFIARPHVVRRGTHSALLAYLQHTTLDGVRKLLPDGLYCLGRSPDDEPQIVETWF
jgi:hypothetical protein